MSSHSLAGVAREDITPPAGTMLLGYHRAGPSTGLLDRLYATVLALATEKEQPLLLLAIDNAGAVVSRTQQIREAVGEVLRLSPERVLVWFSHTHSGPEVTADYLQPLQERVTTAAREAVARLEPVRVGWGVGHVEAAANRRERAGDGRVVMGTNPAGPIDPRLGVLRVDTEYGRPLAVLLCYGAHGNVLKAESNVISADWPGAARHVVECALGCPALIIQNASGNINARWRGSLAALQRMGWAVGGEALKTVAQTETGPLSVLRAGAATIPLRMYPLPGPEAAARLAAEAAQAWNVNTDAWQEEVSRRWSRGETEPTVPLEVTALAVNDGAIAGIPMEPFVEIGLAVAGRFPQQPVFFTGYNNGWIGYLPTPEEYVRGGYEARWAPVVYGVESGWLMPAQVEMSTEVISTAIRQIAELFSQ